MLRRIRCCPRQLLGFVVYDLKSQVSFFFFFFHLSRECFEKNSSYFYGRI